jgi:hypothetical protein
MITDKYTLTSKPRDMALALLEEVVADQDRKWGYLHKPSKRGISEK